MARWVGLAADWLQPIYEQIRTGVLAGGYVQIDETPIRYLAPGHGQTKLAISGPPIARVATCSFDWETSRAAACLENSSPVDFTGTMQCDGYAGLSAPLPNSTQRQIILAGCWAHVRRKFYEAREQAPQRAAGPAPDRTSLPHRSEPARTARRSATARAVRAQPKPPDRASGSQRALVRFKSQPPLPARKACWAKPSTTRLANGPRWTSFSRRPLEIDNNLVENAIRPTAIGKKNWLFIGDADAGERSAILYTIIESCRRRGIDPFAYLRDVLTRLPSMTNWQVKEITPEAWAKTSRSSTTATAA